MNYYNEHDPNAAAVLRELIRVGEIPPGDVDETDIQNVKPTRLAGYIQCHFFAGFGGWMEALNLAGWPHTEPVWTGSCPCQPFSTAGSGLCEADERHLWPDFRNLIAECRPPIVFGEQVAGEAGRAWLAGVSTDMEAIGYQFAAADLCAAGVGSPQKRQRIYWGGASNSNVRVGAACRPQRNVGNLENRHWENVEWVETSDGRKFRNQPGLSMLAHGVPKRVVYLRGFGNAICPPLASEFVIAFDECANDPSSPTRPAGRHDCNSDAIMIANMPRRSLQIDSNYAFVTGIEPWPRYWEQQDKLLASEKLTDEQKQLLQKWIDGKPVHECVERHNAAPSEAADGRRPD